MTTHSQEVGSQPVHDEASFRSKAIELLGSAIDKTEVMLFRKEGKDLGKWWMELKTRVLELIADAQEYWNENCKESGATEPNWSEVKADFESMEPLPSIDELAS